MSAGSPYSFDVDKDVADFAGASGSNYYPEKHGDRMTAADGQPVESLSEHVDETTSMNARIGQVGGRRRQQQRRRRRTQRRSLIVRRKRTRTSRRRRIVH